MEAEAGKVYKVQKELAMDLKTEFGDITFPKPEDWVIANSTETLTVAKISATDPTLLRNDSSGLNSLLTELELDEDSESITSSFKKFVETLTPTRMGYLIQNTRLRAADLPSAVTTTCNKYIHITYHGATVCLNVGPCVFFNDLLLLIKGEPKFEGLSSSENIQIYEIVEGSKSYIRDLPALEAKAHYHVETEEAADEKPKLSTMDEFFGKLKSDEDMTDSQVDVVKSAFTEQGITFKQLMRTGELAITTDEKLKEIGIKQPGLRTAIRAVLKF